MGLFKSLSISSFLLATLFFTSAHAAIFNIQNHCSYTVWAAAVPGGGRRLDRGQSWSLTVNPGTTGARIWARTGCSFDGAGRGRCQTGDCGGVLQCTAYGAPPNTLAEFALNHAPITQGISRLGALMLTATLRMIKPAPLHALVVPTMKLSSAHKASINYSMHVFAINSHFSRIIAYME
ncbi:unnamed protein product, partial [Vitis vinifera]